METAEKLSIVFADDHPVFLEGLVSILKDEFNVLATAKDGLELLECLKIHQPNVVLADLRMPNLDGLSAAIQIKSLYPKIEVVIISFSYEQNFEEKLIQAGVSGYWDKNIPLALVIKYIYKINDGERIFHKPGAVPIVYRIATENGIKECKLSGRELEVIALIRKGKTSIQIGDKLFISENTVEGHRKNIFKKLEVKNLQALIEFANLHSI